MDILIKSYNFIIYELSSHFYYVIVSIIGCISYISCINKLVIYCSVRSPKNEIIEY